MKENREGIKTTGRVIRWAWFYDIGMNILFLGKRNKLDENATQLAEIKPGDKVLDVGCGTGNLAIAAKKIAGDKGEIFGIDPSSEMIEFASKKALKEKIDISFQIGAIENIPFPDNSFDVVLSTLMIHHLPGDELKIKGFSEIHRVLKSGGCLLVVDIDTPNALIAFLSSHHKTSPRQYQPLMEKSGFREIEFGRTGFRMFSFIKGKAEKEKSSLLLKD